MRTPELTFVYAYPLDMVLRQQHEADTSDNQDFKDELKRRYFPVMELFTKSAETSEFLEQPAVEGYFEFVRTRF